ncbi:MAG: hypothetical protein LQ339_002550 [Xanthoria mediterranea]|nr:MAG: hypothetical protein LQ339_002550 [Xanthoria mediterranea]
MGSQHAHDLPLRVAILGCDHNIPKALEKYKSYAAICATLLDAGAKAVGLAREDLEVSLWNVIDEVGQFPELEDVDGVFLTGSKYDSFASTPWITALVSFVQTVLAHQRVKLVGVCFGHQIICRAMGAKVGRNVAKGWEVSVTDVDLTTEGQNYFKKEGKDVLSILQMHQDIVFEYPAGVQPLGSTERCQVQGMLVLGKVVTVQGHPEFTEEILTEILRTRHEQGIFGDEAYQEAMARVGKKHDGLLVGQRFIEFLLDR